MKRHLLEVAIAALVLLAAAPRAVNAAGAGRTDSPWSMSAGFGPTANDLETEGIEWVVYGSRAWRAGGHFLLEGGLHALSYRPGNRRETILLPELTAGLETRWGPARPYLGAGAGLSWVLRDGTDALSGSVHLALGCRWRLHRSWFIRTEIRARSLEPIGEGTLGLGRDLP